MISKALMPELLDRDGRAGEVLGLDVGGAHLKAALARGGRIVAVRQVACRLWEGLDRLGPAFDAALAGLPAPARVALTMTGELVDLFPDRPAGVAELIGAVGRRFPDTPLKIWAGSDGFLAPEQAAQRPAAVASANWLATASLAASRAGNGLMIDIGSTTTDILPLVAGSVRFAGYSDAERLASGELVYQGLTRTPAMAMADRAPLGGRWVPLMNEYFATAADVWRVLGRLDEAHDQHAAADNGPKTAEASARRLARMVGADLGEAGAAHWRDLAAWLARAQLRRIEDGLGLVLSRERLPDKAPLIGAGCGRFLVEGLAAGLGRPYLDLASLIQVEPAAAGMAATCAPAVAVALLLA
jgi:probable H4MPT-linked C1 transfer pathway protein